MGAVVHAEVIDKAMMPRVAWWQLQPNSPPIGPVRSPTLDLGVLSSEARVVALVAETAVVGNNVREADVQMIEKNKVTSMWAAVLREAKPKAEEPKDYLRLIRPDGVQQGGVWLIGVVIREATGDGWRAEAIDEVFPLTRFEKL